MLQTFLPPPLLLFVLALILISYRAMFGLSINIMLFNMGKMMFNSISTTFRQSLSMCCVRQWRRRPHLRRQWINENLPDCFLCPFDHYTMWGWTSSLSTWNTTPRCRTPYKCLGNTKVTDLNIFNLTPWYKNLKLSSEFTGKTFQAAQLTHQRFLTIDRYV
jgi:hypothetical protein